MSVTISGSGQIIKQVIQVVKTDTFSMSSTTYADITGLSVSITPTNASNKILVVFSVNAVPSSTNNGLALQLVRNTTPICIGDPASPRQQATSMIGYSGDPNTTNYCSGTYLDSPATTSAVTYKVQIAIQNSASAFVNRTQNDTAAIYGTRSASTLTVYEVAYA